VTLANLNNEPKMISFFGKRSKNSRWGTADARFLRARNRATRPPGPYRPGYAPKPARDRSLGNYWITIFFLLLIFALAQIWKSHQITMISRQIEVQNQTQQELEERQIALQVKFQEISSFPRVEAFAKINLGMVSPEKPPTIIVALTDKSMDINSTDRYRLAENRH
jgi:hypothetical protein